MRVPALVLTLAALVLSPASPAVAQQPAVAPAPAHAAASRTALTARLDSLMRAALASGRFAGATVAVVRGGDTLLLRGYGLADLEQQVPATPASVFLIGSTTKQFTAAAILQLVERGKLALDDEVTKYLSEYPTQGRRVTVRELLNHTSGIADYTSLGDPFDAMSSSDVPQDSIVTLFARAPFTFEPGTAWSYSNSGYYLLGMILERVSGERYADYLERHVFPAAGLGETYYCDETAIVPQRARGYELTAGRLENTTHLSMLVPYAAGGLCATARDLVRWDRALAAGKVVSPASYRLMVTAAGAARAMVPDSSIRYGFGKMMSTRDGHRLIGHGGAINGFGSSLDTYPDDSLTVAVLVNTTGPAAGALSRMLAGAVLGLPTTPWTKAVPAPAPKEVPLAPGAAARYVGRYPAHPQGGGPRASAMTYTIEVYEEAGRLMTAAPGVKPDRLVPVGGAAGGEAFVLESDPTARLTFTVESGRATKVRLMAGGMVLEGARAP